MVLFYLIKSLRPVQWTKNFFIFAALIFAQKALELPFVLKTLVGFAVFCILSGSLYLFNDILDLEEDRLHPRKSQRPLASGKISKNLAFSVFIALSLLSLLFSFWLEFRFFLISLVYFILQFAYSLKLKHIVILDIFIVATGFVLRVVAGGVVIDVPISSWLLICTSLLALFISMSKRRHELVLLEDNATGHRPILKEYSPYLLDQMIAIVTSSTLIAYCFYSISPETVQKFGSENLVFTVPFVLYGIFRYLYLVHQKQKGGSPEELIISDKPLLIDIGLWILAVFIIVYFARG